MFRQLQDIRFNAFTSIDGNRKIIENCVMKFKVIFNLWRILLFLSFFTFFGCSLEDFGLETNKEEIKNEREKSGENAQTNRTPLVIEPVSNAVIERIFDSQLNEFYIKFMNSIPNPESIDYEKIKLIVNDKFKEEFREETKYQVICDENERWIYRCNLLTGEIECFSMSSNKLRLLSSIK